MEHGSIYTFLKVLPLANNFSRLGCIISIMNVM